MPNYYEFFAGAGMARAGLGEQWKCLFANDFDHKKAVTYRTNWGDGELCVKDIGKLTLREIPGQADLVWASFPCQDLSLAGGGAGLRGERSGTFRPFWKLMTGLISEGRAPKAIVLENVCGALTSHGGKDFATLCGSLVAGGYAVGAVVVDAAHFLPQSRPRLFIIGVNNGTEIPIDVIDTTARLPWHSASLVRAFRSLPINIQRQWIWWKLPPASGSRLCLANVIDESGSVPPWFSDDETQRLLQMMAPLHRAKVEKALRYGKRVVGSVYKRTRPRSDGNREQRAEIRFDGVSGCLRTPAGGSSRQLIVIVEDQRVKVRLISARETARLMGLEDTYILPENYNEAYHLTGDGVVVPAVRHIAEHILRPLASAPACEVEAAA